MTMTQRHIGASRYPAAAVRSRMPGGFCGLVGTRRDIDVIDSQPPER